MTFSDHSGKSEYVAALAALVRTNPSRLSDEARLRVGQILSDPVLNGRAAEKMISALAMDDDQVAALWDEVQATNPMAPRAPDIVNPQRGNDGATHRWYCPVQGCPTDNEPGLAWAPSTITHCKQHGRKLVRRPSAQNHQP